VKANADKLNGGKARSGILLALLVASCVCAQSPFAQSPFATPSGLTRFNSAATTSEIPGLVAWWLLNETNASAQVTDSGPNGYTGTAIGLPGVVSGKVGNAFSFNGSSQWVTNAGTPSSFAFICTNRVFTIAAWVYPNYLATNAAGSVFSTAVSSGETGFLFILENRLGAGTNAVRLLTFRSTSGSYVNFTQSGSTVFATNEWNHIVLSQNGSGSMTLWVNGTNASLGLSTNGPLAAGSLTRAPAIGVSPGASGPLFPFNGTIDDVRIYNRALSATEVGWLYNGGSGTGGNP
jgi:hypothetical protein